VAGSHLVRGEKKGKKKKKRRVDVEKNRHGESTNAENFEASAKADLVKGKGKRRDTASSCCYAGGSDDLLAWVLGHGY